MFPVAPKTRHEYYRHAPKRTPCPLCGTPARRKDILRRTVRGITSWTPPRPRRKPSTL